MSRIAVTGIGMFSAIGNDVHEHLVSLNLGKSGISKLENFGTKYAAIRPVGEIKKTTEEIKSSLHLAEDGITRTTLIALKAFLEATSDASIHNNLIGSADTAIINANTVGGMCLTDEMYAESKPENPPSAYVSSYSYAATGIFFQKYFNSKGIINTINTACSSSANAIMFGARLMKAGIVKRAIVGGSDSLAKLTINGFNALHILSAEPCRPFDANRCGLNLGEGGAYLVLEWEEDARDKKIYGYLSGYANTNDSFHASSLSPEGIGPKLSMERALKRANLSPDKIDYINAHGTATENNDLVESVAMKNIFGVVPCFNSTKCLTGHTLGAAGALEAAISLLSLHNQTIFPAVNYSNPIPETMLIPTIEKTSRMIHHVMSNSFGFGGNCSTLIFSKT